nr:MAG TPA: hypothetical protein [Caudoviricetes sp.]
MTAFTSVEDEPGRNLRNLEEPWEPLRSWTGIGDGVGDVYGPSRRGRWAGAAASGGRTCTARIGDVYAPPSEALVRGRIPAARDVEGRARTPRGWPRNTAEK